MRTIATPCLADKAAESLTRQRKYLSANMGDRIGFFVGGLRIGVKFLLPPMRTAFDAEPWAQTPGTFRLPFQEIILMQPDHAPNGNDVVIWVAENDGMELHSMAAACKPRTNDWRLLPPMGVMACEQNQLPDSIKLGLAGETTEAGVLSRRDDFLLAGTIFVNVMRFLYLLALPKIGVRVFLGASASVNNKRASKGKLQISTHRVLEVKVPGVQYERKPRGLTTHKSPDPHMRRGHWRHLTDGRVTWVSQSAVRGGAQPKDYLINLGAIRHD